MTKYKQTKLKELTKEYNKYILLINKSDFKNLPCIDKVSIQSIALNKADKLIHFVKSNSSFK